MSSASSAPSTKPEASSRTRSQVITMSGQTFLAVGRHRSAARLIDVIDKLSPQGNQTQAHAALHCAERSVGLVRNLTLGEAVEIGQFDGLALSRRQNHERNSDLLRVQPTRNLGPDVRQC